MRLFIALTLPDDLKRDVARVQDGLKRNRMQVSWTRPEGMHLTLKFLGEVRETAVDVIRESLSNAVAGFSPFSVELVGVDVFPHLHHPRVIWIGAKDSGGSLARLQKAIERELAGRGFPREKREWTPHLTLGRVRLVTDVESFKRAVEEKKEETFGSFDVREAEVIKSDLTPSGAVYTKVAGVFL